ncbi:MAG: hypothetical protein FWG14_05360 [Peptococcaceae bacterium]|nr:hypothetical protein [Peptococcaceae bacterium]
MPDNTLQMRHTFDRERCRHEINGLTSVLHCHHFASLTTQLANDCQLLDAKKLLAHCAEDTFYLVLTDYYRKNNIMGLEKRFRVGEQYFAEVGLGKLAVTYAGPYSGEVVLEHSHIDEGWVKKWGVTDKAVNHIGCGYVCALFAAAYDRNRREFTAFELQSIARGAAKSVIRVMDVTDAGGK